MLIYALTARAMSTFDHSTPSATTSQISVRRAENSSSNWMAVNIWNRMNTIQSVLPSLNRKAIECSAFGITM